MGKIYCMGDIHGFYDAFARRLGQLDLRAVMDGEDALVLLGDYIDGGPESGRVLEKIYEIQRLCGENCVVLRGNHEELLLEWLDAYAGPGAEQTDEYGLPPWSDWLRTDEDFRTLRSLITKAQWDHFSRVLPTLSEDSLNMVAARMVMETSGERVRWLRGLPYYYETEKQIFVHAGIDEGCGELWKHGTPESTFVGKYPAAMGTFEKDVIAGHIGTHTLMGDPDFHDVLWDGESHYFCDGTVWKGGNLPVLVYDRDTGEYSALGDHGLRPIPRCPKEQVDKRRGN